MTDRPHVSLLVITWTDNAANRGPNLLFATTQYIWHFVSVHFGPRWECYCEPQVLPLQDFYGILRIVSDCMSNVMKHFKCKTATVDLHVLMNNSHVIQSFPLAFQLFPGFIYISFPA